MYEEENRSFNLVNFIIRAILVIIIILFAVWLLSLSNKGITKSLNVLTDNIFNENIDRMKEAGKSYFTTERLPKKVGEIETLTLEQMYKKELILEVKDKDGNACSAKNSYVSIEKFDNEYQMKIYLECGDVSDQVIVIMGCYNYCDKDICEVDDSKSNSSPVNVPSTDKPSTDKPSTDKPSTDEPEQKIEYEYKKTIPGSWTDYGNWSDWSTVVISKNDYRQVETKVVKEEYTYDKTVVTNEYKALIVSCPNGYTKTSDGKCTKSVSSVSYSELSCPDTYNGLSLTSQTDSSCVYSKVSTTTTNPVCPTSYNGYTYSSRNGITCSYSKTVVASIDYVYSCSSSCSMKPVYTYKNEYISANNAYCTKGTLSGNTCVISSTSTETTAKSCPSGYSKTSDGRCAKNTTTTATTDDRNYSCPSGYSKTSDGKQCFKEVSSIVKETATKDVTYYRYRVREYIDGSVDYKWSTSKEDKNLLNAGYVLTGKTR